MASEFDQELRRIAAELHNFPYVPRTWHWLSRPDGPDFTDGSRGMWGNAAGGHAQITGCVAGAPVYHDIIAEGGSGSRADVHRVCDMVILEVEPHTKREVATATAVARVALARLGVIDDVVLAKPSLPAGAGEYYTPVHQFVPRQPRVASQSARSVPALGQALAAFLRSPRLAASTAQGLVWYRLAARLVWRQALAGAGEPFGQTPCEVCRCQPGAKASCRWRTTGGGPHIGLADLSRPGASGGAQDAISL